MLDVVGGRWKAVILFHLVDGTKRFGDLKRFLSNVMQRILTLHLRQLALSVGRFTPSYRRDPSQKVVFRTAKEQLLSFEHR
jgi:DNA-binding HxlR family transcriptional regulator